MFLMFAAEKLILHFGIGSAGTKLALHHPASIVLFQCDQNSIRVFANRHQMLENQLFGKRMDRPDLETAKV